MGRLLAAALGGILLSSAALASDAPPDVCETQQTTRDILECVEWERSMADRWLNQVYAIVRGEKDEQGQRLLRDAQRAWIAWRDATCAAEADEMRGGTLAPVAELACQEQKTLQRARDLGLSLEGADPPTFIDDTTGRRVGTFACDGQMSEARLGLSPTMEGPHPVQVQLMVGTEGFYWPVDPTREDALCGADVRLEIIRNPVNATCPALAVEDGLCDRMVVYWDGTHFVAQRGGE